MFQAIDLCKGGSAGARTMPFVLACTRPLQHANQAPKELLQADVRDAGSPGAAAGSPSGDPTWFRSGEVAKGALRGRLHNTASGLCLGVVGGRAVAGAETELTACSAGKVQQWTYETDGLLRNAAEPDLCLDSRLGYSVRLARCTGEARKDADSARYDFTVQGTLVPRSGQDLGLAPAATDGSGALVLKARDDTDAQRWRSAPRNPASRRRPSPGTSSRTRTRTKRGPRRTGPAGCSQFLRQPQLGPDGLALGGVSAAPPLGELGDQEQPPAALVPGLGAPQMRGGVTGVGNLADQR